MKRDNLFFIDAETDGLYGQILSVAVIVTDEKCKEIERKYWGLDIKPKQLESQWVRQNVLPIMANYETCQNELELIENVWKLWRKYERSAYAVGDVIFPVETGLFSKCVGQDIKEREFKAPVPFVDMNSVLLAKGLDPMVEREALLSDLPIGIKHNALYDVEIMIKLWKKYMGGKSDAANS